MDVCVLCIIMSIIMAEKPILKNKEKEMKGILKTNYLKRKLLISQLMAIKQRKSSLEEVYMIVSAKKCQLKY